MNASGDGRAASAQDRLTLPQHAMRSLRLAIPVMLGRAGLIIMISVDSIMTGRAGATELAHYAISLAPHMTFLVIGIGLLLGTGVLTAQSDGAGRPADCGAIWHTALILSGALGTGGGVALLWGEDILLLLGQSPEIAAGGGDALRMFGAGLPAILMYAATTFFLEGINRPVPGMLVALAANVLNAGLNWLLIDGNLGLPAMGAAGAALATTLSRWVMLIVLVGHVLSMRDGAAYGVAAVREAGRGAARKLLRIGAPLSVATGLQSGCYATVAAFAGRLGEVPLASYQIAFNVITFVFMFSIGLSTATSVRVANAVGRRDRAGMVIAGWTGIGLVGLLMLMVGLAIRLFDGEIARLYSTESAVLALAVSALAVVSAMVVVDGAQTVVLGTLRGLGDVVVPTASYAVSFWAVGVPAAYALGLKGEAGTVGLFWGLLAGVTCALLLLGWRFAVVARRAVQPM